MIASAQDKEILGGLREFADKVAVPLETANAGVLHDSAELYERETGGYSRQAQELMRKVRVESAKAGYYALGAPESIGGGGISSLLLYRVWEMVHRTYGAQQVLPHKAVAHWTSGPSELCAHFSAELRNQVLEDIVGGRLVGCFAMSEPEAGSDARAMSTTAVRDGDEWVINGSKQWISGGPTADFAYVFAVTDQDARQDRSGGITCFYVPLSSDGFTLDRVIKLFGHVGGEEAILSLRDVRVPMSNVVGEVGQGFRLAMKGVNAGRMYNAGRSVGLARWALEKATIYARERRTFGRPIDEYQGVSFQLAESAIEIYAADCMAIDCAARMDAGEEASTELSIVKAFTTEMAFRVIDRCIQVHGGMGLANEVGLVDAWHAIRIIRIADGSAEIMRRNIGRALSKGRYRA